MDRVIDFEDVEFIVDAEEDTSYLDNGYPWNEELDFNKEVVTEYLPESSEDEYEESEYYD